MVSLLAESAGARILSEAEIWTLSTEPVSQYDQTVVFLLKSGKTAARENLSALVLARRHNLLERKREDLPPGSDPATPPFLLTHHAIVRYLERYGGKEPRVKSLTRLDEQIKTAVYVPSKSKPGGEVWESQDGTPFIVTQNDDGPRTCKTVLPRKKSGRNPDAIEG